ncbi:hypothetical protein [Psychrilyobacter atlanticus]|nr:hypothetical protein [Psychrilyobacter atlanticus]
MNINAITIAGKVGGGKLTTPKNVDLHKHRDTESSLTTIPE